MGAWRVELVLKAQDDLAKLDRAVRQRVINRLEWLATNFDSIKPEPLHGDWKGFFKLRTSNWRAAYNFDSSTHLITVHQIDPRDKIYKKRR